MKVSDVICALCKAAVGERCTLLTADGFVAHLPYYHATRVDVALAQLEEKIAARLEAVNKIDQVYDQQEFARVDSITRVLRDQIAGLETRVDFFSKLCARLAEGS